MIDWLPRLVARVPATVHTKLLAAFLIIALLLIVVGAVGLAALNGANRRADELVQLQRKIAVYRQLQHDTTAQLYSVASALLVPEERTLQATLRQLNQFGYDVDRLHFVAKEEVELLARFQEDYEQFLKVVTRVVELIGIGKVAEGRELQFTQASRLADRMERLMNELVNRAESDIVESVEASHAAYQTSRWMVIAYALASIALALLLGFAISSSLTVPVRQFDTRLKEIAAGDFSKAVEVANRDELGTLAANLNRMSGELGRLYQQIETRNRELKESLEHQTATSEILRVIAGSPSDVQPVFDIIAERAARLCDAILGFVFRFDGEWIHVASVFGMIPEGLKAIGERFPMRPGSCSVAARTISEGVVVNVPDILALPEYQHKDAAQLAGFRGALGVPMVRQDQIVGAIMVTRADVGYFSDKQVELLQTFASQAVIAIENVRLFQELRARTQALTRSVEELKALGEVGQAVSSTLDLETVLTTIVSRATELSGSDGGVIWEFHETTQTFHVMATHNIAPEHLASVHADPTGRGSHRTRRGHTGPFRSQIFSTSANPSLCRCAIFSRGSAFDLSLRFRVSASGGCWAGSLSGGRRLEILRAKW